MQDRTFKHYDMSGNFQRVIKESELDWTAEEIEYAIKEGWLEEVNYVVESMTRNCSTCGGDPTKHRWQPRTTVWLIDKNCPVAVPDDGRRSLLKEDGKLE